MNSTNPYMNHGLGDALMESAIKLEKLFFEKFPEIYIQHKKSGACGRLTLGNKAFEDEVQKRLPGKSKNLFKYFNRTRNSILHYGDSEKNIRDNEQTRRETSAEDIRSAGIALLALLALAIEDEDKIREACESALTKNVFDKVFGTSIKPAPTLQATWQSQLHSHVSQQSEVGKDLESGKVLDLLDGSKKQSRRQGHKVEAGAAAAPGIPDNAKANALDLFAEVKKSDESNRPNDKKNGICGISKVAGQTPRHPEFIKGTDIAYAASPVPVDYANHEYAEEPKLLVIKPPILVSALADRLGLMPFNVMADLIKMGVFPAPDQPIEPGIAAKICEIHGFAFDRGKPDKSGHQDGL